MSATILFHISMYFESMHGKGETVPDCPRQIICNSAKAFTLVLGRLIIIKSRVQVIGITEFIVAC